MWLQSSGHEVAKLNQGLFPGGFIFNVAEQGLEAVEGFDSVGEPGSPLGGLGLFPIAGCERVFGGRFQLTEFSIQVGEVTEEKKMLAVCREPQTGEIGETQSVEFGQGGGVIDEVKRPPKPCR